MTVNNVLSGIRQGIMLLTTNYFKILHNSRRSGGLTILSITMKKSAAGGRFGDATEEIDLRTIIDYE